MLERRERWFVLIVISGLLVFTTTPYLVATMYAGEEYVFGGFLLNPIDGNSYLAKMYQGWRGDTQFTLPFTAEISHGSYLFMLYLGLGHLARYFGISLPLTFHLFRSVSLLLMLISMYYFIGVLVSDRTVRRLAFVLATFGSGLGWMFLAFGLVTSDFWIAEAYPFLSAYANPHFPLSLALIMFLLSINHSRNYFEGRMIILHWGLLLTLSSFVLAIISPFGVVLVVLVLGTTLVWESKFSISCIKQSPYTYHLICVLLGGTPIMFYYLWITNNDPLLRIWNAQNQTTSPPIWDIFISFSPVLIFAALASWTVLQKTFNPVYILICWVVIGFIMLYMPVGLQRRFMLGFHIPLAILAAIWISKNLSKSQSFNIWVGILILLVIPTNVIILLAGWSGIQEYDPAIYHTKGESIAFEWIEKNTPANALILASAETGLLIPAYTGRRVIYGHPFETVNAEQKEAVVTRFFNGSTNIEDYNTINTVDYIFEGPRERKVGGIPTELILDKVYQNQDIVIYRPKW